MKKKEINKISKKIFKKLNKSYFTQKEGGDIYLNEAKEIAVKERDNECEYNEEVSNKFKNLFNNIIKYPDNIRISYTESYISIEIGDIRYIKKAYPTSKGPTTPTTLNKSNDNNRLTIYIHKDKYFNLTQGYIIQTNYTDVNMYNELIDITKDKVSEINASNFNNIWENISKESGILRDFNLDEILK